ncbi:luciferin sulfotransferase-like [Drosophila albomicans]|uniref:Luciferin sulfotransferase-like n=1 Tax=Drosophila albomicans TaxID=7291 RepID=A0A6P8YNJ8_DROAB|nr:luciferin sulfotransferase-like [Drosophila albomicans]
MYESKPLKTLCLKPMMQLRCIDDPESGESAGDWLPLKQDWSTRWCTLPERYMDGWVDLISNFNTRDSDVFVVTFMKAGATWMQELAWMLRHNLDFVSAANKQSFLRCPYLEFSANNDSAKFHNTLKAADDLISPRVIKSHLPAQLLPLQIFQKNRKIIYVARNPKDVIVSAFPFTTAIKMWQGDLDTFIDEFLNDKVLYCSYWSHVIDFWRMRNNPNIFFVTYEEMKRDLKDVIQRLCKFLGVNELKECEMNPLLAYLSFDNMKKQEFLNPTDLVRKRENNLREDFDFMRRGIVGSYKEDLTADQIAKIDLWSHTCLSQYGICESDIFGKI